MSSRREPHFSSHRVLNAVAMPLAASPARADRLTSSRPSVAGLVPLVSVGVHEFSDLKQSRL
jgi:hypothetical protein